MGSCHFVDWMQDMRQLLEKGLTAGPAERRLLRTSSWRTKRRDAEKADIITFRKFLGCVVSSWKCTRQVTWQLALLRSGALSSQLSALSCRLPAVGSSTHAPRSGHVFEGHMRRGIADSPQQGIALSAPTEGWGMQGLVVAADSVPTPPVYHIRGIPLHCSKILANRNSCGGDATITWWFQNRTINPTQRAYLTYLCV
ncbi:hypothetical protein SODALDRAFT_358807 [Sodiomyces alkalinus F11]|uniref:Uncharacterized protein n=1 Tax=Sodiomyces alkalinus (strain CBS 110278 / VKM F-3762 / F11) TaxID=1314773 RepID=A0A3N2PWS4_SODAK|nr:hypothetical protein SODALDRAFT_358807 [Sodiomyces alkalinus F11]ROT38970.1 hypothetical protein SODALDRAFT_358807 [Sodiomyces alkalinus F11]